MILKGNQRGDGADLAIHLMNGFDNESVEIAEVYGTVAGDLYGAFAEFEAVSRGTKATEYIYSLSISPPKPLTRAQYYEVIAATEHRLGLTDQPRTVVFHVKDGREHCHVVWSRIDLENMRAIHMSHDRSKLMDLACEFAHKFGFDLPPGLKAWEEKQKFEKDYLEATLAENAQAKETGIAPEQRRAEITAAYEASDSGEAFRAALEQKGYILAKGGKRGFVVVDKFGDAHSLTRYVKGHKPGAIKKKLLPLTPDQLPSADQAKEMMRQRMQAQDDRQREQQKKQQRGGQTPKDLAQERILAKENARKAWAEASAKRLREFRQREQDRLARKQAASRLEVQQAAQEQLTLQQAERLVLHAAQKSESGGFLFRVRSAVADLIARTPGLRSVLGHLQKLTHLDPKERHRLESDALARRHAREKLDIERRRRTLAHVEKRENQSFEKAMRRQERLEQEARLEMERTLEQAHTVDNTAMQDFYDSARDQGLWKDKEFQEGELREDFNDAAEFQQGAQGSGGDDETHAPDLDESADDDGGDDEGPGHRPRRSRRKGFGYRRDSD